MTGENHNPKTHRTHLPPTAAQCNPWGTSRERKIRANLLRKGPGTSKHPQDSPTGLISLQTTSSPRTQLPHYPQQEEMAAILLPVETAG